jgi:hypothetical protein
VNATVKVAWDANVYRVPHAIDPQGRPLLLCRSGGALDRALTSNDAVVIRVAGAAGQVWISGWAEPVVDRAAVLDFAAANPQGDLLDVGRGYGLYRIDVAEVRLQRANGELVEIDVADYVSALSGPVT